MYNESNSIKEKRLEVIEAGFMPYGKYENKSLASIPLDYVRYLVDQNQKQNVDQVNKTLLLAFEETHPKAFITLPGSINMFISTWGVGASVTFRAILVARFTYEGRHGAVNVTKFIKDSGEMILHSGTRPQIIADCDLGDALKMSALVKGFNVYKDTEKQNLIKNIKNVEVLDKL